MRYDADRKERTRYRVVSEAAKLLRSDGLLQTSVGQIMSAAGLTHGGFYAHFPSRDVLLAEALHMAFEESLTLFERSSEGRGPRDALGYFVKAYLSPKHRDMRGMGCPMPSTASDACRLPEIVKAEFNRGQERMLRKLRKLLTEAQVPDASKAASSVLAELVGALMLARGTGSDEASNRLLKDSQRSILERLGLGEVV